MRSLLTFLSMLFFLAVTIQQISQGSVWALIPASLLGTELIMWAVRRATG